MILYTIQNKKKWKEFKKTGILKSHEKFICDKSFLDSYDWLENKMRKMLPTSDITCVHPIWAWYKYNGEAPNIKNKGFLSKGKIAYLIKFEVDDNLVLLSDFNKWHLILNHSEEDLKSKNTILSFEEGDDILDYQNEGFIFDGNNFTYNWNNIILNKNTNIKFVQATLWYVKYEQVISFKKFKAK